MMKKSTYISFFLLILTISAFGQLKPISDQYVLNPLTINPAYAGNRGYLNIAAFYRHQWVGIEGAPRTITLAADAPFLGDKLGLGLSLSNDRIGVTNETAINTFYYYKRGMGDGNLSFGLGAGIITTNTKWSDLVAIDQGDDGFLVDSKTFVVPDFSFGVYYYFRNYFAGVSVPRLLSYEFDYDANKYSLEVSPENYYYLFNTGYLLNISEKIKFLPSTLLYYIPGEDLLYDINAHVSLMDKFWVGASYKSERSVAAFFQAQVNDQLRIAYTYNFDLAPLSKYSSGTHEIMLRYEFRYEADVVNPLVF
jgi:type IX secretion system PorP/SprF family membrane protein